MPQTSGPRLSPEGSPATVQVPLLLPDVWGCQSHAWCPRVRFWRLAEVQAGTSGGTLGARGGHKTAVLLFLPAANELIDYSFSLGLRLVCVFP